MRPFTDIGKGSHYPLGAVFDGEGVNFALFSAHAEKVELCLFDERGEQEVIRLAIDHCTDQVWHIYLAGLKPGALYGYRVYGPYEPEYGHRFNHHKLLLDPYAKSIQGKLIWHEALYSYTMDDPRQDLSYNRIDSAPYMPKAVVIEPIALSQRQRPTKQRVPWSDTIIYEAHVRGFTKKHPNIPPIFQGTFAGLAHDEAIDHLLNLGVTSIELLPVQGFVHDHFLVKKNLKNYWGYNSLNFFAPHTEYLCEGNQLSGPQQFRAMVDRLHDAGLEVILDVVYNHTAEGDQAGPTLSFRGIDNLSYYGLQAQNPRFYINDTGCGNAINAENPRVLQMIMDSLRYWATDMQVDGFRFDLATILGREAAGFNAGSGFFDAVLQDPVLSTVKLIAEPWDIGPGGYQLGNYPIGWSEWNDHYRDTCRRFWRGDAGLLPEFARRLHGSSDLFEHSGRGPRSSINFVASHDGFTLADVVSYNQRHNEANQENNNDGHHANFSCNYGVEGPADDKEIRAVRAQQQRNFIATLLLSQGTPMLLAGDELGRTQQGNNNAYCQDSEISWLDWSILSEKAQQDLLEFSRYMIVVRKRFSLLRTDFFIHKPEEETVDNDCNIYWLNNDGQEMMDGHWTEQHVRDLAWLLVRKIPSEKQGDLDIQWEQLLMVFNAHQEDIEFNMPTIHPADQWERVVDTCRDNGKPTDIAVKSDAALKVCARSIQVFYSKI